MFSEPKTDLKRIEEECLEEATLIIKKTTPNAETSEKLIPGNTFGHSVK